MAGPFQVVGSAVRIARLLGSIFQRRSSGPAFGCNMVLRPERMWENDNWVVVGFLDTLAYTEQTRLLTSLLSVARRRTNAERIQLDNLRNRPDFINPSVSSGLQRSAASERKMDLYYAGIPTGLKWDDNPFIRQAVSIMEQQRATREGSGWAFDVPTKAGPVTLERRQAFTMRGAILYLLDQIWNNQIEKAKRGLPVWANTLGEGGRADRCRPIAYMAYNKNEAADFLNAGASYLLRYQLLDGRLLRLSPGIFAQIQFVER